MEDNIIIKTENVGFTYNDGVDDQASFADKFQPVLKNVSLNIRRGEYVAVLGHNGSGKSTFAKLLNLILTPTVGKIYIDGIDITNPDMTRFLMNLDEAVDLVKFAFEHANPGDLFIQKADASTIGTLAKAVQQLFGDTGTQIIGTRHGEKLYETLMTREEKLRSEDMGKYYRVAADSRDLNYDKFVVKGEVNTEADDSYTSHNTNLLDVEGTVNKILTTDYVKEQLK